MLNDIYNKRIIELAGNIPRLGRLPAPDASATAHSKLCGSTVKVDLKMDGPVVTDFAHDVKACALGQASSSIMARHVVGSTASELRELRETVRKMLKENGSPAARQMGRHRAARAGARLQGAPCLDHADLRRRGRRHRPDRGQAAGRRAGVGRIRHAPREHGSQRPRNDDSHLTLRLLRHLPAPYRGAAGRNRASAVLVDFAAADCPGVGRTAHEAILHRLGSQLRPPARRACRLRQHVGHRIGGDEIGQPQFVPATIRAGLPRAARSATATAGRPPRPCRRCIWRAGRCRARRSSGPARCSSRPWHRRRGRPSRSDAPGHARPPARNASCPTAAGTRTSIRNRLRASRWRGRPAAVWVCDADADGGQRARGCASAVRARWSR